MPTLIERAVELYGRTPAFEVLLAVGEAERLRQSDLIDIDILEDYFRKLRHAILMDVTPDISEIKFRATLDALESHHRETLAAATHH
jgi:hypothetical protein